MSENQTGSTSQGTYTRVEYNAAGAHFRSAGIEILKGVRQLLDMGIHTLSHEHATPANKGTTVPVE